MKKFILIISFLIFFIFPTKAHANCSFEELNKLKAVAAEATLTYEYDDNGFFNMVLSNFTDQFYVERENSPGIGGFYYSGSDVIRDSYYPGNTTYDFVFYASEFTDCDNRVLRKTSVKTPPVNPHYNQETCEGIEEYYLCGKFVDVSEYSLEDFANKLYSYRIEKAAKQAEKNIDTEEVEKTFFEIIKNFIFKNYVWILAGIIILGSASIFTILYVQKKRSIIWKK